MSDNDKKRPKGLDNADSLRPPKKRVRDGAMSFISNRQAKPKSSAKEAPKKPKNKD